MFFYSNASASTYKAKAGLIRKLRIISNKFDKHNLFSQIAEDALVHVAQNGYTEIVQYLCEIGVKPCEGEYENEGTPLFHAVKQGNPEMVSCLVEHGDDINYSTLNMFNDCQTIWAAAIQRISPNIVKRVQQEEAICFFYKRDGVLCFSSKADGSINEIEVVAALKERQNKLQAYKNRTFILNYLLKKGINTHTSLCESAENELMGFFQHAIATSHTAVQEERRSVVSVAFDGTEAAGNSIKSKFGF